MSIVEKIKSQPKTLLATVAIAGVTVGFAGGVGVGKASSSVANNQVQLGNNGQGMIPPGQGGQPGGNGQGMTPPDQGNTTDTSNTSSDEINELKKKNQEIQSQIESKNQ